MARSVLCRADAAKSDNDAPEVNNAKIIYGGLGKQHRSHFFGAFAFELFQADCSVSGEGGGTGSKCVNTCEWENIALPCISLAKDNHINALSNRTIHLGEDERPRPHLLSRKKHDIAATTNESWQVLHIVEGVDVLWSGSMGTYTGRRFS